MADRRTATEAGWIDAVEAQRVKLGWSKQRVALEAGFDIDYWSKIVRGVKGNATLETVERVNRAVGLKISVAPSL
jgi:hypothetical protein